jgi:S-adenosyl methyltransferase
VERPNWAPKDVDMDRPSVARVYDYYLGGFHNFAVDREFAEKVIQAVPEVIIAARENRAFLRRAVRHLVDLGIRQFLDLGSGIPTVGNVHEVAQSVDPTSKVVYVDLDPVAYSHSRAILADNPHATAVCADLREPAEVLADPRLRAHLDFDQPMGILLVGVLHFVLDEQRPADIVAAYASASAPGSHVVISHASVEGKPENSDEGVTLYNRSTATVVLRDADQVEGLLDGLTVLEPGVVMLPKWYPDSPDEAGPGEVPCLAAVGRRD